jgi:hypothetical protein
MNISRYFAPLSELANEDITGRQLWRIMLSQKEFCIICGNKVHLVSDPDDVIRKRYRDEPAYNIKVYCLHE